MWYERRSYHRLVSVSLLGRDTGIPVRRNTSGIEYQSVPAIPLNSTVIQDERESSSSAPLKSSESRSSEATQIGIVSRDDAQDDRS